MQVLMLMFTYQSESLGRCVLFTNAPAALSELLLQSVPRLQNTPSCFKTFPHSLITHIFSKHLACMSKPLWFECQNSSLRSQEFFKDLFAYL